MIYIRRVILQNHMQHDRSTSHAFGALPIKREQHPQEAAWKLMLLQHQLLSGQQHQYQCWGGRKPERTIGERETGSSRHWQTGRQLFHDKQKSEEGSDDSKMAWPDLEECEKSGNSEERTDQNKSISKMNLKIGSK
ncbi:Hypothetical predicted protein [Podarcis lilfordi]|uniref:Uncharacterized protein n=1 Tax=Podarcis lilfordi TaxID=74358 RepID=A0AA35PFY9_9SAUR|nr:Hypothetical predicted protein [Podarcis lilfordi]